MDFLQQFIVYRLEDLPFVVIALMIAFTVHEYAHAYTAYRFGDRTAKDQGRVTLDPRKHLDVIGTLLIFIAGFGWAKPVPVNRSHFSKPRLMGIIVSAAGPLSNLIIAFIGMACYQLLLSTGWTPTSSGLAQAIEHFYYIVIELNIILFIFNLIPLPPLDGYRIVQDLATDRMRARISPYEQWGIAVFLLIIVIEPLYRVTIQPLFQLRFVIFDLFTKVIAIFT